MKAVKAIYAAIVTTLENIYEQSHEPELSKVLLRRKLLRLFLYLTIYKLPQVATLSKVFHSEHLDLSAVASLVDATLHTLDDALLPAANWVLELLEESRNLETATGIKIA